MISRTLASVVLGISALLVGCDALQDATEQLSSMGNSPGAALKRAEIAKRKQTERRKTDASDTSRESSQPTDTRANVTDAMPDGDVDIVRGRAFPRYAHNGNALIGDYPACRVYWTSSRYGSINAGSLGIDGISPLHDGLVYLGSISVVLKDFGPDDIIELNDGFQDLLSEVVVPSVLNDLHARPRAMKKISSRGHDSILGLGVGFYLDGYAYEGGKRSSYFRDNGIASGILEIEDSARAARATRTRELPAASFLIPVDVEGRPIFHAARPTGVHRESTSLNGTVALTERLERQSNLVEARFWTPSEQQLSSGGSIRVPSTPPEPALEDVRMAMLRAFSRNGGATLSDESCLLRGGSLNAVQAIVYLEDFRLDSVSRNHNGTFTCTVEYSARYQKRKSFLGAVHISNFELTSNDRMRQIIDVALTSDGWWAPTIVKTMNQAQIDGLESLTRALTTPVGD